MVVTIAFFYAIHIQFLSNSSHNCVHMMLEGFFTSMDAHWTHTCSFSILSNRRLMPYKLIQSIASYHAKQEQTSVRIFNSRVCFFLLCSLDGVPWAARISEALEECWVRRIHVCCHVAFICTNILIPFSLYIAHSQLCLLSMVGKLVALFMCR